MSDSPDLSTAIAPTNSDAVPKLLSEIATTGDAYSKASNSILARRELLAKARELVRALESPRDMMLQHVWSQPCNIMAISFGVQTGLWTTMAKNGDGPQKAIDLARQLGIQEELLQRMMRHIAASGYIDMTAPDEYTPNSFSNPAILHPSFLRAHDWLREKGYTCPTDNLDTPFQAAHNTTLHLFAYLQANPPHAQQFQDHMQAYLLGRPQWMDEGFYPIQERVLDGFATAADIDDAVLFVDVAGGLGHYTEALLSKFPAIPGRLILQDLPPVIESIQELHPRIERMGYDFFTEQPVKGARVYYMHTVLHDWPDEKAAEIASGVKRAMQPGYSRLLVHENVIPPMAQDREQTTLDLIMMTHFGGKERSAAEWFDLLEGRCGLKVMKIWTPINGIESVIECERPE
ncbi:S-adenosyl-L-methionine-dependent methyltransferase [Apiospora marii]|uniref:S-adenosyl-L-methionine-dependent methyltransferase n=1 Tax=Apiospora marii TaxID=335849 RepID=A0ABR1RKA0_9PEZI